MGSRFITRAFVVLVFNLSLQAEQKDTEPFGFTQSVDASALVDSYESAGDDAEVVPLEKSVVDAVGSVAGAVSIGSEMTLVPAAKTVGAGAVRYALLVDTDNDWAASVDADWVTVTPGSGRGQSLITVTLKTNSTLSSRSAIIMIGGAPHMLTQLPSGAAGYDLMGAGDNSGKLGVLDHPHTRPSSIFSEVASVASGGSHTLFVKTDGSLWGMGWNSSGQLGDGSAADRSTPVQIATGVASVSAGSSHTLFVKTDGSLWGMGSNDSGQLGDGSTTGRFTPVQIATGVASVSAGSSHTLFVKTDGSLWVVGKNDSGQLGDGTIISRSTPVQIATDVASVSAGLDHTLFVKTDSSLWAVGSNAYGELGDGTNIYRSNPVQIATGVASVSAGLHHTLFVKTDSSLWAMGNNSFGPLGDGTETYRSSPVQVATGVTSVSAAGYYTVFVKIDGSLWGMGYNYSGQLGNGGPAGYVVSPVQVATGVIEASAGGGVTLFVKTDGSLWGMGANNSGRLGDGLARSHATPTQVTAEVASMSAGSYHSLYLKTDGSLWAAGANVAGQLGDGTFSPRRSPVAITTGVASMSAGYYHTLFVKTDGSLWAMGDNRYSQLGDGTTTNRSTPVQIATGVASVSAGHDHSLFVKTDGSLWAMGANSSGQLGDGTTTTRTTPVQVATGVASVTAGFYHTLFIKTDGSLWAVGDNSSGQIGDGAGAGCTIPVQVATGVASVAAGHYHSLFVKTDGSLWGIGSNGSGQLGYGTNYGRPNPSQITTRVASVAAGHYHSLFVKTDGSLWAMGYNEYGRLGDGTTINRNLPVLVATGVVSVDTEELHTLFLLGPEGRIGLPPLNAPAITTHPEARTTTYGQTVTFSVTANGLAPLTYQWLKNGIAVSGQTANTLTLTNVSAGDAGLYSVRVTNDQGSTRSYTAALTLGTLPGITTQPISQTVLTGQTVTFTVTASGTTPSYQWRRNGSNLTDGGSLSGATGATLTITNAQAGDAGSYDVVVTNAGGTATSEAATLTVNQPAPPSITGQSPTRQVLTPGQSLTLSVTASGTGSFSYQWTHNGRPIAGATGASLPLANVTRQDSGYYLVLVTDANGTTRSAPIFVTVVPAITQVVAWGDNGQDQATPPTFLSDATVVDGGSNHTLALRANGTVTGWGSSSRYLPLPTSPDNFVAIAAGDIHNLALRADGSVACWNAGGVLPVPAGLGSVVAIAAGRGTSFALRADGTVGTWHTLTGSALTQPAVLDHVVGIAAGLYHLLALKDDGTVVGYDPTSGVINPAAVVPSGLSGVVAIATSDGHSLALKEDGTVVAWGDNDFGQTNVPGSLGAVAAVAAGHDYSLVLKTDGTVVGWGRNGYGESTAPAGLAGLFALTAGHAHAAALRDATQDVAPTITTQPQGQTVNVNSYVSFTVVAAGAGPLRYQWRRNGVNISGATGSEYILAAVQAAQAGDYTVVVSSGGASVTSVPATLVVRTPPSVSVPGLRQLGLAGQSTTFSVSAIGYAPLAYQWQRLLVSNNSATWANIGEGGIFSGTNTATLTINPVAASMSGERYRCVVSNVAGSVTTSAGTLVLISLAGGLKVAAAEVHSLFLRADGTLWGSGSLGFDPAAGADTPVRNIPIQMAADVVAVSSSATHKLLIKSDGSLWAMGDNTFGQLCDGTTTNRTAPTQVATGVVAAVAANQRSYFIRTDGTLWVAGANGWGWFGTGLLGTQQTPVQVAIDVRAVAAGDRHVLVLKSDGGLWAAGTGSYGQLGLGNASTVSLGFAQVTTGVRAIAAGAFHSLFIKADGSLWGMGSNEFGELGDGGGVNRSTPVPITTGVVAAFGGAYRSLFIKADGSLWGMGENSQGVLGDGATSNRLAPVQIATNVVAAALGGGHEIFTKADGGVWSVGNNSSGQLGDSTNNNHFFPVPIADGTLAVPAAPAGLSASDATAYTGVHVGWTPATGVLHYQVFRHTADASAGATLLADRVGPAYYHDTTATRGVTYYYWVRAVNPAGTSGFSTSDTGSAAVPALPVINAHPANRIYNQHAPAAAVFTVTATGTGPLAYQWRRNGLNLGDSFYVHGANTPSLSLTDQSTSDAGTITVVVSNGAGSVESNPATLSVGYPPSIYQQPLGLTVDLGAPAAFTVVPITDAALPAPTYVWRKDGVVLQGATSPTLSIASAQLVDAGSYTVEVANMFGSVTSAPVTLTVAAGFNLWQLAKFDVTERLDPAISGPNADPDHDGFANLLEYALGLEPKAASTTGLPEAGSLGSDWTYTFSRPDSVADVTCTVEASFDLVSWSANGVSLDFISNTGGFDHWRARYPLAGTPRIFFRLQVTRP